MILKIEMVNCEHYKSFVRIENCKMYKKQGKREYGKRKKKLEI